MADGLRESAAFVQSLVREEVRKVGYENVVLGGLSQGCATVLTTMLLGSGWTEHEAEGASDILPAATFGMCGWLPYAEMIEGELGLAVAKNTSHGAADEQSDDPFEHGKETDTQQTRLARIREMLRSELNLPILQDAQDMSRPIFIGHGAIDDRVSVNLGRQAARCMEGVGLDVRWKEYELLGHWYSDDMLRDIVIFLQEKVGWEVEGVETEDD